MALEGTLQQLAERRTSFKAYRETVEEELRQLRLQKLAAEQASIEHLVVKAMAEGATLGQVKRAYGTKDHRTIATIVTARASEIEALRNSWLTEKAKTQDWFKIEDDTVLVVLEGHGAARFTWSEVDGELMFTTNEPLWNEDFTIKNEAVGLLDGKTESESEEAAIVAAAIREG